MRQNPERLAWTVLLVSFAVCVALAISAPLITRWWIDTAHVGLKVTSSVQQGTVQVTCEGDAVPGAITERMDDVCRGVESMTILTLSGDQGTFTLYTRGVPPQPVAELQVDANTQLKILQARAPRFSISSQPYILVIHIESGRVRVSAQGNPRPTSVQVATPEALVQTSEGSVAVQVSPGATQVGVREGTALVIWSGKNQGLKLLALQSASVPPAGDELEALPPARDLIVNGDFGSPLEAAWQTYSKDIEIEGEPAGELAIRSSNTITAVGFTRIGRGHAETGLTQLVNRSVQNVRSLQLRLTLRILEQDVPVCGTRGTECPLMVKIEYQDTQGDTRTWLQGFYASPDPYHVNPPFCPICSPRADHLRLEQDEWYVYDSPDLIPLLNQIGPPPTRILSVTLYASGHTYRSEVSRIALLAQE